MIATAFILSIFLAQTAVDDSSKARPSTTCREWHECQQLALDAAGRHDYETFHDLSWRAVQTGPPKDPALMYMLARAQCLSGRPHDALVMLQRLAEMGAALDAATNEDFRLTRELPGWPDVAALIARAANGGSAQSPAPPSRKDAPRPAPSDPVPNPAQTSPATRPAPSAPSPVVVPPDVVKPVPSPAPAAASARASVTPPPVPPATPETRARGSAAGLAATTKLASVEEAARVSAARFSATGLAYDSVSHRFVVGDSRGRKLMVVSDGADHAIDLVRNDSAGFHEIAGFEIDERRGDLWVVTGTEVASDWTVHKLQLVSGRPLQTMAVTSDLAPMQVVDLAVTPGGMLLALDAAGNRLLALRPGAANLRSVLRLPISQPVSLAGTSDEGTFYITHEGGISRVDLRSGILVPVVGPSGVDLRQIERLRWHRNTLYAVQADADGSRRILRLELNASGRSITAATIIDTSIPAAGGRTFATISGDELSYLVSTGSPDQQTPTVPASDYIIRRVHLR